MKWHHIREQDTMYWRKGRRALRNDTISCYSRIQRQVIRDYHTRRYRKYTQVMSPSLSDDYNQYCYPSTPNSSPGWYNIGLSNLSQLSNAALTWMVSVSPKRLLTRRTAWRPHSFSPLRQLKIAPNRYNPTTSVIPQEMYTEAKATALGFRLPKD